MHLTDIKTLKPAINRSVLLFMVDEYGNIDRAEKGYLTPTAGIYSVKFPVTHWCPLPRVESEQKVWY